MTSRALAILCLLACACGSGSTPGAGLDGSAELDGGAGDLATSGSTDGGSDAAQGGSDASTMAKVVGHVAYMSSCGTGYANIGTLSGLAVCESPLPRTTVLSTQATCMNGQRVGDYSGPYYQSVCAFDGHLGVGQFAGSCPSGLMNLEPSANGTVNCGKVATQLYWRQASGCPTGWTDAGQGLGVGHICRRDQVGSLVYLTGACPAGWESVDEYCVSPTDVLAATMNACPSGWQDLGGGGGGTHVCLKP